MDGAAANRSALKIWLANAGLRPGRHYTVDGVVDERTTITFIMDVKVSAVLPYLYQAEATWFALRSQAFLYTLLAALYKEAPK